MKRIAIIITCLAGLKVSAQDVHFSQFWNTPMHVNPAQTGLTPGNMRFILAHRSQWSSVKSPYRTYMFNGEYKFSTKGNTEIGTGLYVHRDVAGSVNFGTTKAQAAVSALIGFNKKSKLGVGLMGGILQKGIKRDEMMWSSQYQNGMYNGGIDPGENINMNPGVKADVSAGIVYLFHSDEKYMTANDQFSMVLGFSYNHITSPRTAWTDQTVDTLYSNFIGHGSANIGFGNTKLSMQPGFLLMFQGPSTEILFGSNFRYRLQENSKVTGFVKSSYIGMGTFVRMGDAIIPNVHFGFDMYELGVSYDLNISSLRRASNMRGGFEITLKFRTPASGRFAAAMIN